MRAARVQAGHFEAGWRRRFEHFAETYRDEHSVSGWSAQGLAARLETFIAAYQRLSCLTRAVRVLDVGCGPGTYGRWLSARGNTVVGVDYSLPSLRQARRHDGARSQRATYAQADAYHLPFRAGAFDVVICVGVLQTLAEDRRALSEMTRVLRAEGVLILDGLNALGLAAFVHSVLHVRHYPGHQLVRYSPSQLRRCLNDLGYTDVALSPVVILPARLRRLGSALGRAGVAALFVAQSFLLIGRKTRGGRPCAA